MVFRTQPRASISSKYQFCGLLINLYSRTPITSYSVQYSGCMISFFFTRYTGLTCLVKQAVASLRNPLGDNYLYNIADSLRGTVGVDRYILQRLAIDYPKKRCAITPVTNLGVRHLRY